MPHVNLSITTGGTAETILGADLTRLSVRINPTTEDLWVKFGGTAAVNDGILIASGTVEFFNADEYPDIKEAISVRSANTAAKINLLWGKR